MSFFFSLADLWGSFTLQLPDHTVFYNGFSNTDGQPQYSANNAAFHTTSADVGQSAANDTGMAGIITQSDQRVSSSSCIQPGLTMPMVFTPFSMPAHAAGIANYPGQVAQGPTTSTFNHPGFNIQGESPLPVLDGIGSGSKPSASTNKQNPTTEGLTATKTHVCATEGCRLSFKRRSDLRRHEKKHDSPIWHCLEHGCRFRGQHGFYRLDKLTSHQTNKHGLGLKHVRWGCSSATESPTRIIEVPLSLAGLKSTDRILLVRSSEHMKLPDRFEVDTDGYLLWVMVQQDGSVIRGNWWTFHG